MPITQVPQWSILQSKPERITAFLDAQKEQIFSYREVGQTRGAPPRGYNYDDNHVQIGEGDADFTRACEALMAWRMMPQNWVTIIPLDGGAVAEGLTIAMRVHALGLWWLNAARVVYTVAEVAPVRRFGFAYGTLSAHVEQGEELFTIEQWADGTVWYRVQAFSRPNFWPVKLARSLARVLQRKFVRDSQAAMVSLMSG